MNKKIYKYEDVKEDIIKAVHLISDPVIQTLSPKGSNVLFEDDMGGQYVTNDGVTIAKNIDVSDPLLSSIINVIKQPALQTNSIVGDGTTTTILFSKTAILEGMKLLDNGMNKMVLKEKFKDMADKLKARLKKQLKKIDSKAELRKIAEISANNDKEIAEDVIEIIDTAGEDGLVMIEPNHKEKTELLKDTGFNIKSGLYPELAVDSSYSVKYENIPVLITDKRLYYKQEADTIIRTALTAGWDKVGIIARDFIGTSANYFFANHNKTIKIILIKDPECTEKDNTSIRDIATYLGGNVVSEKDGKLVNKITVADFVFAKTIYSNRVKTVIATANPDNKELKERIKNLKEEADKEKDNKDVKNRLAALTNGMVTVKVGGRTPIEVQERIYRYEDAINAVRSAMKHGYLIGGGMAMLKSFNAKDYSDDMVNVARRFSQASLKQISNNCGKHFETILDNINLNEDIGYNAKTDTFGNLLEDGVIDPYMVTEMAIDNSISIATHLLTSGYIIINDIEYEKYKREKGNKED